MPQQHKTVLLAEDDPDDFFIMERAFKRMQIPHRLIRVTNGVEAIAYLKAEGPFSNREHFPPPELILLDIKMPQKDGFEVLDFVRKTAGTISPIVVMLSSSGHPADIQRAQELGANSYLVKPCDMEKAQEMVQVLCHYWFDFHRLPRPQVNA